MSYCAACRRPLKTARPSGYGPVCERRANLAPAVERDLFGYDTAAAATAATERVQIHVEGLASQARAELRRQFRETRVSLGVWSA